MRDLHCYCFRAHGGKISHFMAGRQQCTSFTAIDSGFTVFKLATIETTLEMPNNDSACFRAHSALISGLTLL